MRRTHHELCDPEVNLDTLSPNQIYNLLQLGEIDPVAASELQQEYNPNKSHRKIVTEGFLRLILTLMMAIFGFYLAWNFLFAKQ